jgi:predicted enzyme related to lactoylglutathione lyase
MIEGIGGVFLRSHQPAQLAAWYRDVLGLDWEAQGEAFYFREFPVREADGERRLTRAVWAIFPAAADEAAAAGVTINYRVNDFDAFLARIRSLDVPVTRTEDNDYGRFAWLADPDGNEVELWQDIAMEA